MRLIDADKFLKKILTAGIGKTIIEYSESDIGYMIRRQPTVYAAEVLRDQWISVEDRLPEGFRPVIVCREKVKGEYVVEQGYKDVGDWWKVYGTRTKKVTHWMALPELPEDLVFEDDEEDTDDEE